MFGTFVSPQSDEFPATPATGRVTCYQEGMEVMENFDEIEVSERPNAEWIDGYSTSEDSPEGEGFSVELWKWNGEYFVRQEEVHTTFGPTGRTQVWSDWHDLGDITKKQALKEMDEIFNELTAD